ncbi:hypothetical protein SAMN05443639_105352 [Stigmatella erecta]|uniref:Uncharacterized protein n=1 Tax=Stigmatella erecta TaxID=83460 RepID=A0A1I0I7Y2_9BACT|nr:hypothetical protein SAMN05443639_105352 [Stigmatella erecta]
MAIRQVANARRLAEPEERAGVGIERIAHS